MGTINVGNGHKNLLKEGNVFVADFGCFCGRICGIKQKPP